MTLYVPLKFSAELKINWIKGSRYVELFLRSQGGDNERWGNAPQGGGDNNYGGGRGGGGGYQETFLTFLQENSS